LTHSIPDLDCVQEKEQSINEIRRRIMKNNDLIKKALDYNKKGFETIFEAAEKVQGKAEEYTGKAVDDATFVPEQGKALLKNWIETGRKARTGFRNAVLKGHERLESLLSAA
jgi:Mg2+ and Co2+ transporter CorA